MMRHLFFKTFLKILSLGNLLCSKRNNATQNDLLLENNLVVMVINLPCDCFIRIWDLFVHNSTFYK